jgi:translation initiation factor IF-2
MMIKNRSQSASSPRPPVVVIMGHVDHGKSTLLDYIRKTNVVAGESGGITQHVSAYEVEHKTKDGEEKRVTFLDTPGHEAFAAMRSRGARAADVAVLVVSAEDGVKKQTLEALQCIKDAGIPYVVAINKIDLPNSDIERTKQSLAENEIFLEGYGGNVPYVAISAKSGDGVSELLDLIILAGELEDISGNASVPAEGVVIESHTDPQRGVSATLIITNGTLTNGMFVLADKSLAPTRRIENFLGIPTKTASFSSPVRLAGFSTLPSVGAKFVSFHSKSEMEKALKKDNGTEPDGDEENNNSVVIQEPETEKIFLPLVVKADTLGTAEAVVDEANKLDSERVGIKIIHAGAGTVSKNDVQLVGSNEHAIIVGFRVEIDKDARELSERLGIAVGVFDVIYKLTEWLTEELKTRTPKIEIEEIEGEAKILKIFSKTKDKQIAGGEVLSGIINAGSQIKIKRRGDILGKGKITELQQQKSKAKKIEAGNEFGVQIQSKIEIAPGDRIETFRLVQK